MGWNTSRALAASAGWAGAERACRNSGERADVQGTAPVEAGDGSHMIEPGSPSPSRPPAMLADLPATDEERRASGRTERKRVSRGTLGHWAGKRLIQSATDIFVGWGSLYGRDYYVRQFRDMKIIPTTELIAPRLTEFATACGEALARAHARTGDPVAIDGYIGKGRKFTAAISRFARLYADQNERDHAQLVGAIAAGAVEGQPG
jgi:uncharacterized protein DUF2252